MCAMPTANYPTQIIGADLIGPFVISPQGNSYVLTITNHCSGFAEVYAIPRKTNEEVWTVFRQTYFPCHFYPDILITNQGQEFNALTWKDYLKEVGVQHHRTTPYNPQSNERTERFNHTFKEIIKKLVKTS